MPSSRRELRRRPPAAARFPPAGGKVPKPRSLSSALTTDRDRSFEGGPVPGENGSSGAVLPDENAYRLFENYCGNEFARAFKLYKLYARAAPFAAYESQNSR